MKSIYALFVFLLFCTSAFSKPLVDATTFVHYVGINGGKDSVIVSRSLGLAIREAVFAGKAVTFQPDKPNIDYVSVNGFSTGVVGFFSMPVPVKGSCKLSSLGDVGCLVERNRIVYRTIPANLLDKVVNYGDLKMLVLARSGLSDAAFSVVWDNFVDYFIKVLSAGNIVELPSLGFFELPDISKEFDFIFSEDLGIVDGSDKRGTRQLVFDRCVTYAGHVATGTEFSCYEDYCRVIEGPYKGENCYNVNNLCKIPSGSVLECQENGAFNFYFKIIGTDMGKVTYQTTDILFDPGLSVCTGTTCTYRYQSPYLPLNSVVVFALKPNSDANYYFDSDNNDCLQLSKDSNFIYVPVTGQAEYHCTVTFYKKGGKFNLNVIGGGSLSFSNERVLLGSKKIISCSLANSPCVAEYDSGYGVTINKVVASGYTVSYLGTCPSEGNFVPSAGLDYNCDVIFYPKDRNVIVIKPGSGSLNVSDGSTNLLCDTPNGCLFAIPVAQPPATNPKIVITPILTNGQTTDQYGQCSKNDSGYSLSLGSFAGLYVCKFTFSQPTGNTLIVEPILRVLGAPITGSKITTSPESIRPVARTPDLNCIAEGGKDSVCIVKYPETGGNVKLVSTLPKGLSVVFIGPDCPISITADSTINIPKGSKDYKCFVYLYNLSAVVSSCPTIDYFCTDNQLCNDAVEYKRYQECCERTKVTFIEHPSTPDLYNKPDGILCESGGVKTCYPDDLKCTSFKCIETTSTKEASASIVPSCTANQQTLCDCFRGDGLYVDTPQAAKCREIKRTYLTDYIADCDLIDYYATIGSNIYGGKTMCPVETSAAPLGIYLPCSLFTDRCYLESYKDDPKKVYVDAPDTVVCGAINGLFIPAVETTTDYIVPLDENGVAVELPEGLNLDGCFDDNGVFMKCSVKNAGVTGVNFLSLEWVYECPFYLRFTRQSGNRKYQVRPRGFNWTHPSTGTEIRLNEVNPYFSDFSFTGANRVTCSADTNPPCETRDFAFDYTVEYAGPDQIYCGISGGEEDGKALGLSSVKCGPIWVGGCRGGIMLDICDPDIKYDENDTAVYSFGNETCGMVSLNVESFYNDIFLSSVGLLETLGSRTIYGKPDGYPGDNFGYEDDPEKRYIIRNGDYLGSTLYLNTLDTQIGTNEQLRQGYVDHAELFYNEHVFQKLEDCDVPELVSDYTFIINE